MVVVVAPSRCRRCLGRVRIVALLHYHRPLIASLLLLLLLRIVIAAAIIVPYRGIESMLQFVSWNPSLVAVIK